MLQVLQYGTGITALYAWKFLDRSLGGLGVPLTGVPVRYRSALCMGQYFSGGIFKLLWSPEIDSKESIPPAYVAWRAGTRNLFILGSWPS
jgi:hypothetical protein